MKRRLGSAAVTRFVLTVSMPAQQQGMPARKYYFRLVPAAQSAKEEPATPSKVLHPDKRTGGCAMAKADPPAATIAHPVRPARGEGMEIRGGVGPGSPPGLPLVTAWLRLGLRYNVPKVNPETAQAREVDPDVNFQDGGCSAIRFVPNRSGRPYLFNSGTTGTWRPLLPSPEMLGEGSAVQAGASTQVPRNYCPVIGPPGNGRAPVLYEFRIAHREGGEFHP